MTAARKVSIPALVRMLAEAGKPFQVYQDKDGNTTLTGLTTPVIAKPMADIREKMAKRIDEIPSREVRTRSN